jgi:shikimate kinase
MKIYLIGMPGSGKTTIGKQVANKLLVPFVDLDHEIELKEKQGIPEIFNKLGEDHFRQAESALLREWAGSDKSFVMATGGGAPCFYNSIEVINGSGISIFLDVDTSELLERVKEKSDRPLLQNEKDDQALKKKLEALKKERLPVYRQASIILKNPGVADVLEKLRLRK